MSKTAKKVHSKQVVMPARVASLWLKQHAKPEYRFTIYRGARDIRNLPNMLKSFRDGKLKIGSVEPILDLGINVGFDQVEVWSRDRKALLLLKTWVEERGVETSGVW